MAAGLSPYRGTSPNPHVHYGENDMMNAPVAIANIATRWGDVQLNNGWQNTNYGRRMNWNVAAFNVAVRPSSPGQTRLSGTNPADFPIKGMAPSQWSDYVASGPGAQPNYPGGPGFIMGTLNHYGSYGG